MTAVPPRPRRPAFRVAHSQSPAYGRQVHFRRGPKWGPSAAVPLRLSTASASPVGRVPTGPFAYSLPCLALPPPPLVPRSGGWLALAGLPGGYGGIHAARRALSRPASVPAVKPLDHSPVPRPCQSFRGRGGFQAVSPPARTHVTQPP